MLAELVPNVPAHGARVSSASIPSQFDQAPMYAMSTSLLAVFEFSFSVTGPIFVILGLGHWLYRRGLLNDGFVETGSRLVFNVTLPVMLFISVSKTPINLTANFRLVGFGIVATFIVWALAEVFAQWRVTPARDRGVVVQGIFRSNMAVTGLAYAVNAYGDEGLAAASLYVGLVTILFNVLAVVSLVRSLHASRGMGRIVRSVVANPLIIGIVLALPVSWAQLSLPGMVVQAGEYFARMTLPLALLCIGASLNFGSLRRETANTALAAVGKLVVVPLIFVVGGIEAGFRGMDLGILLLMSSTPTAASSYVMVRAMGGNAPLAANIVALSTVGSLVSTSVGVVVLRSVGLM